MKRKYYSHEQLQQRSVEWLNARMGRFTSSQIFKLFARATAAETKQVAIEAFKTGKYKGLGLNPSLYTEDEISTAAKTLGFKGAELKKIKKELESELVSEGEKKVLEMCECLKDIVVFSAGAKKHILKKASEFVFPEPENNFQSEEMQRGLENEYFAVEAYKKASKYKELDVSFVELGEDHASSPDKLFQTSKEEGSLSVGLEVKCPNQINFSYCKNYVTTPTELFEYSPAYFYQCHHQIWVCDLDFVDWVCYHKSLDGSPYSCLHGIRIHREESIISQFEKVLPEAVRLRDAETKILVQNRKYPFLNS